MASRAYPLLFVCFISAYKLFRTFTGAPTASLPLKVVVEGSPLSLKREALGLDLSGPEPLLSFGEVFVHGGKTFRVIKVNEELRSPYTAAVVQ